MAVYFRRAWTDFLAAMQFLTCVPVPSRPYDIGSLPRSVVFFPLVGAVVGSGAALLHWLLAPHVARPVAALFVLLYLVLVTGGLHEDGLADAADGFGGGRSRDQILAIMRDSRIGSYGGLALGCSVLLRLVHLASMPLAQVPHFLIAGSVLSRWTILPLSYFLPSARDPDPSGKEGQGARIAGRIPLGTLLAGTLFSFAAGLLLLKGQAPAATLSVLALAWLTGMYYKRRIGGVTGDCLGASVQLAELAVYLCGAWVAPLA